MSLRLLKSLPGKITRFARKYSFTRSYAALLAKIGNDERIRESGSQPTALQIAKMFEEQKKSAASAACEIATFFVNSGYPEIAQTYHEFSLKLSLDPATYSLYLQGLLLNTSCTEEQMYKAAIQYEKLFLGHVKRYKKYSNELTTDRRLNVGYICHFFHNCVSKSLLVPFMSAHNRDRIKLICYSDAEPADVPDYIKAVPEVWRDTKTLNDAELAEKIREDKIDILLEMNGHIIVNRYLTIARKPAPIQISHYNIATTTGISSIDYLIAGDEMSLQKVDPYYTESLYYIKGVSGVAKFPDTFPDVTLEPPCLKNKFITFGSFGGAQKINKDVVKLWCKVLKAIPDSRFYMKAGVLTFEAYLKSYRKLFSDEGIDLERIHFEGFSEHHDMLKCYAKMDIGLDSFPHNAATTTMEATWQGVPVITYSGKRQCMQHGKVILDSFGHPELIAYSEDEFIRKAVELASDPDRLIKYRQQLRDDFKRSPRADVGAFAAKLEDAYHDMWGKYCRAAVGDRR